ncbi:MAG: magnesium transporter [Burkholderiales bacterium]|nr:magnesium transporter [Phycisphaerae bacterium]
MSDESQLVDGGVATDLITGEIVITPELLESSPGRIAQTIEEAPADQGARVLEQLPLDVAAAVSEYLDPKTAARIFKEVDSGTAAGVVLAMNRAEAAMVLAEMDPDDRVDILGLIYPEAHEELLAELDAAKAAETRSLESYARDTAGGIMTTQVTALYEYLTVEDAINLLRKLSQELEQMFYVYAIDRLGRLVGVLSMRDLILAKPSSQLRNIMIKNVRSVPATMDQEEVARLMRGSGYLAMPVVDDIRKLIGLITVDDVVDVIQDEATEDIQKMFGAGAEERLNSAWHFSFRKRVFWLQINLLTAFLAAAVISSFQEVIKVLPLLAAFQTIVSGMGGNGSAQAMAVTIRGMATGQVDRKLLRHVLRRELIVGILTGIAVGLSTWAVAAVFYHDQQGLKIGAVIAVALLFNQINACVSGAAIPFVMKKLGFDPAQSSTIFATTLTDCGGFFATLGLGYLLMNWLTV